MAILRAVEKKGVARYTTMSDQVAKKILKDVFGYDAFRGYQADIIADFNRGENLLVVMPTGAGKSLCFQVPALMKDGLTIVVSPLISLMQNQVEALQLLGVSAAAIHSGNSPDDNRRIWQQMRQSQLKLLYMSPEKLMSERMLAILSDLDIAFFAIDEAHCIAQWGAAFRPEYEALSRLHRDFPHIPIMALTATADQVTRDQICEKIFSHKVKPYLSGFDRPNISLCVDIKQGWKQQLLRFLKDRPRESGIVYCLSRKKTEEAAALLQEKGYNALSYHAGLCNEIREDNLNRFMADPDLIMVATIAFGMGIDKPDIRFVFHTDLPASPEAYYQEIGRAGRDGLPAVAQMLYGMEDIRLRRLFIEDEAADDAHKRRSHQRLNALLSFCEAPQCRRVSLLHYFGDEPDYTACGNCDLCTNPRPTRAATEEARKLLSALYRTGQNFGMGHIVDILIGKQTERMQQLSHHQLPTFGVGQNLTAQDWKSIARQLMARGFIMADMAYGALKITAQGLLLLKGESTFDYRPDAVLKKKTSANKARSTAPEGASSLSDAQQKLFRALKNYRKELARARAVPAYVIFSDKSLLDMAENQPENLEEFGDIYGVGAAKQKEFGPPFIAFIQEQKAGT